jgi:hypothetical protein
LNIRNNTQSCDVFRHHRIAGELKLALISNG